MELNYKNVNGYLLPELEYKSGEQMTHLGKYGFLRRDYLKNYKLAKYQVMLLQDTLGEHLLEIDEAAREREEIILKHLEESDPLPDKAIDQMAWVKAVNQHKAIAEEIILAELIYI
ncbi:TnpV protein [Oliverpabstia intestinalis]|uniref:TnpV protein n=1 Tax=Dorea formicigenerans TaxID=39486 RepID=A0A848CE34_9FIRM|nr:TnpV protein [Dorea formicigenerans]NME56114.1 TnpV protein [Dorea formicigenerans]